ncbi:MAG: MT-A70 family methyltransferase [Xanthobacteraceae bacterium]
MFPDSIDGVGLDLLGFAGERKFATILADPPWQFTNKTGKVAPEHRRLSRYRTLTLDDIKALPLQHIAAQKAHLYLWCPNALLPEGVAVMKAWGFTYKSNIVWHNQADENYRPTWKTYANHSAVGREARLLSSASR